MLPSSMLDPKDITWDYFDKAFWVSPSNIHTIIELLILISTQLNDILSRLDAIEADIRDLWTAINNAMGSITDIWGNIADLWQEIIDIWDDLAAHTATDEMLFDLIKSYHP